jgi:ABC-type multidrug transport system fused ATPase/permease subunit
MNYRYNIDPSNTLTDDKLWAALDIVQMKEVIMALPHQLGNGYEVCSLLKNLL